MLAMTDAIQGRVAAEEAISINKFDKDDKQVKPNNQQDMKEYVAETG